MQRSVMHAPTIFFLLIAAIMKRGKNIASFFAPVNKKVKETAVRETSQGIERAEVLLSSLNTLTCASDSPSSCWKRESRRRLERGHLMKVRALTQRGKFQRVRRMKKRVRRKKTYRDRERNSQRYSK